MTSETVREYETVDPFRFRSLLRCKDVSAWTYEQIRDLILKEVERLRIKTDEIRRDEGTDEEKNRLIGEIEEMIRTRLHFCDFVFASEFRLNAYIIGYFKGETGGASDPIGGYRSVLRQTALFNSLGRATPEPIRVPSEETVDGEEGRVQQDPEAILPPACRTHPHGNNLTVIRDDLTITVGTSLGGRSGAGQGNSREVATKLQPLKVVVSQGTTSSQFNELRGGFDGKGVSASRYVERCATGAVSPAQYVSRNYPGAGSVQTRTELRRLYRENAGEDIQGWIKKTRHLYGNRSDEKRCFVPEAILWGQGVTKNSPKLLPICAYCWRNGHYNISCPFPNGLADPHTTCADCGKTGHEYKFCNAGLSRVQCAECGRWGHTVEKCPKLKKHMPVEDDKKNDPTNFYDMRGNCRVPTRKEELDYFCSEIVGLRRADKATRSESSQAAGREKSSSAVSPPEGSSLVGFLNRDSSPQVVPDKNAGSERSRTFTGTVTMPQDAGPTDVISILRIGSANNHDNNQELSMASEPTATNPTPTDPPHTLNEELPSLQLPPQFMCSNGSNAAVTNQNRTDLRTEQIRESAMLSQSTDTSSQAEVELLSTTNKTIQSANTQLFDKVFLDTVVGDTTETEKITSNESRFSLPVAASGKVPVSSASNYHQGKRNKLKPSTNKRVGLARVSPLEQQPSTPPSIAVTDNNNERSSHNTENVENWLKNLAIKKRGTARNSGATAAVSLPESRVLSQLTRADSLPSVTSQNLFPSLTEAGHDTEGALTEDSNQIEVQLHQSASDAETFATKLNGDVKRGSSGGETVPTVRMHTGYRRQGVPQSGGSPAVTNSKPIINTKRTGIDYARRPTAKNIGREKSKHSQASTQQTLQNKATHAKEYEVLSREVHSLERGLNATRNESGTPTPHNLQPLFQQSISHTEKTSIKLNDDSQLQSRFGKKRPDKVMRTEFVWQGMLQFGGAPAAANFKHTVVTKKQVFNDAERPMEKHNDRNQSKISEVVGQRKTRSRTSGDERGKASAGKIASLERGFNDTRSGSETPVPTSKPASEVENVITHSLHHANPSLKERPGRRQTRATAGDGIGASMIIPKAAKERKPPAIRKRKHLLNAADPNSLRNHKSTQERFVSSQPPPKRRRTSPSSKRTQPERTARKEITKQKIKLGHLKTTYIVKSKDNPSEPVERDRYRNGVRALKTLNPACKSGGEGLKEWFEVEPSSSNRILYAKPLTHGRRYVSQEIGVRVTRSRHIETVSAIRLPVIENASESVVADIRESLKEAKCGANSDFNLLLRKMDTIFGRMKNKNSSFVSGALVSEIFRFEADEEIENLLHWVQLSSIQKLIHFIKALIARDKSFKEAIESQIPVFVDRVREESTAYLLGKVYVSSIMDGVLSATDDVFSRKQEWSQRRVDFIRTILKIMWDHYKGWKYKGVSSQTELRRVLIKFNIINLLNDGRHPLQIFATSDDSTVTDFIAHACLIEAEKKVTTLLSLLVTNCLKQVELEKEDFQIPHFTKLDPSLYSEGIHVSYERRFKLEKRTDINRKRKRVVEDNIQLLKTADAIVRKTEGEIRDLWANLERAESDLVPFIWKAITTSRILTTPQTKPQKRMKTLCQRVGCLKKSGFIAGVVKLYRIEFIREIEMTHASSMSENGTMSDEEIEELVNLI